MDKQDLLEKVGQMFVVGFPGKHVIEGVKRLIHDYRVGNIILFGQNVGTPNELLELTSKLQEEAKVAGHTHPLLISVDQENGVVRRIKDQVTLFPGAMSLGAADSIDLAKEVGLATGRELRSLGINWNLAPVLDVNNNPNNPVINVRSFGEDPRKVGELGIAWMKGIQEAGVAATLKHFPGHGDTDTDSHLDLPSVNHSLERLFDVELVPFIQGIKNGADAIMTAHIYFSTIEPEYGRPATLSKNVLTGLLRNQLGFDGVITTDSLEMNAISKTVGVVNGALQAATAGADLLMITRTYDFQVEAVQRIVNACQTGEIDVEQILASNNRVMKLKEKYSGVGIGSNYNREQHEGLAKRAYKESISVLKDETLPIPLEKRKHLALFVSKEPMLQVVEKEESNLLEIKKKYKDQIDFMEMSSNDHLETQWAEIKKTLNNYEQIILFTKSLKLDDPLTKMLQELVLSSKTTVISLKNPYDFKLLNKADNFICAFDDTPTAIQAALDVLFGDETPTGKVPVTI